MARPGGRGSLGGVFVTEDAENQVSYGPQGAPQVLLEAREIADAIGGASPSEQDAGNRAIAELMVWCGLAAANPGQAPGYIAEAMSAAAQAGDDRPAAANRIARALALNDPDAAVQFAESAPSENSRDRARAVVAGVIAAADPERAEHLAREIIDPGQRVVALAAVAAGIAGRDPDGARRLTTEAGALAEKEVPEETRSAALCDVIEAVAVTDPVRAGELASQLPGEDVGEIRRALAIMAVSWARSDPDLAEHLATSQESHAHQAVTLAQVAAALQPVDPIRSAALAGAADALADETSDDFGPASVITALTYQRMAGAFAPVDPVRALGYAHAVETAPENALIKVDTLVEIASAIPAQRNPPPNS